MKDFVLVLSFLLSSIWAVQGQNVKLSGQVKDSTGIGMEMANVIAFDKESNSMAGYSITDAKGNYKLQLPSAKLYTIRVSYIGYQTLIQEVELKDEDLIIDLVLSSENTLDEVEISYEMPVTIKGDTIVYDADSFSNGTEKKLEDVLENLPGVEVDENGEVEVEGKTVQKVLVNGKEFFDGDTKVATKNIPADAIDKVEVLKNYSEVSSMRNVRNNEDNIALNIKLKTGKEKFWFGEVSGGLGVSENEDQGLRYSAKPKLFYYSPKTSINVLTDFNNVGEPPFTRQDYFRFTGGLGSGPRESFTDVNVSDAGLGFTTLQNNRALQITSDFGAANFSQEINESMRIGGFGIYNHSNTEILTESRTLYNETGFVEQRITDTRQDSQQGIAKLDLSYNPGDYLQVDYDMIAKKNASDQRTDVTSTDRGDVDTRLDEAPSSVNQNLNAYYTLSPKHIFALETAYLWQDNTPEFNSIADDQPFSVIPADPGQSRYNLFQDKSLTSRKFDLKLDYYFLINNKSNVNIAFGSTLLGQDYSTNMSQQLDNGQVIDLNDASLIGQSDYNFQDYFTGVFYNFVKGIFTVRPGFTLHSYRVDDRQDTNVIKEDLVFLPNVYARLSFKSSESLRFNYRMQTTFADVTSREDAFVLNSWNSLFGGNRDLDYSRYNTYDLSYFKFSMFSFTNIVARLSYSKRVDAIRNQIQLIDNGVDQVSSPINSAYPEENFTAFFQYGKTFKNFKVNARANLNQSKFTNIVDGEPTTSDNFSQVYRASGSTNIKNAPNFELGYQVSLNQFTSQNSVTQQPFVNMDVVFLKNFIFSGDYSYYNFKNQGQGLENTYGFLNATLFYQKRDSKWEFSVEAKNLTNNTTLVTDRFNELSNSTTTSLYYVQPRFWLLRVKYNL
jgi:hypothetical protein